MRTSTTVTLALALGASSTAFATSPVPQGGSIQALLHRQAARTHRGIPVDTLPGYIKSDNVTGDVTLKNTTVIVLPHVPKHNESVVIVAPTEKASETKLVKRNKAKKEEKRWDLEDSSPTDGVPSPGVHANLLGGSATAIPVNTPTGKPVAPSLMPKEAIVILSSLPAELSAIPSSAGVRKIHHGAQAHQRRAQDFSHDNRKRWNWGKSTSEDEDLSAKEVEEEALYSTISAKARSTSTSSSHAHVASGSSSAAPRQHKVAAAYYNGEDLEELDEKEEAEETTTTSSTSSKARVHHHHKTSSPSASSSVILPYRLAQLQRASPSPALSAMSTSSTRRRHRTSTLSSTSTQSSNSTSTAHRRARPTPSTSSHPVARVAKLQMTTILASRMERANARGQPTDVVRGAEEDEEEIEKREVEEEDCEEDEEE